MRGALAALALLGLASVAAADPFADRVVALEIGPGGGAGDPSQALGAPHGRGAFVGSRHTVSLGLGGTITLEFVDNRIVDGPGPDFIVFENAFLVSGLVTYPPWAEPATVSVSDDGVSFVPFPCARDAAPYFPGCAGVYPVFATEDDPAGALVPTTAPIESLVGRSVDGFAPPPGAGGDAFDLSEVGLAQARFVRIDGAESRFGLEGLAGFDLDAVAAVHSLDLVGDRDGDGTADGADPCPDDASCRPPMAPVWSGGPARAGDRLLTYAAPVAREVTVPIDETRIVLAVVVADDVRPGSLRVRAGRDDLTPAIGPVVPGTTKMVAVPLAAGRTIVRVRARGRGGRVDVDRFIIRREEPGA